MVRVLSPCWPASGALGAAPGTSPGTLAASIIGPRLSSAHGELFRRTHAAHTAVPRDGSAGTRARAGIRGTPHHPHGDRTARLQRASPGHRGGAQGADGTASRIYVGARASRAA